MYTITFTPYNNAKPETYHSIVGQAETFEGIIEILPDCIVPGSTPSGPYEDGELTDLYLHQHEFLCTHRNDIGYYMVCLGRDFPRSSLVFSWPIDGHQQYVECHMLKKFLPIFHKDLRKNVHYVMWHRSGPDVWHRIKKIRLSRHYNHESIRQYEITYTNGQTALVMSSDYVYLKVIPNVYDGYIKSVTYVKAEAKRGRNSI